MASGDAIVYHAAEDADHEQPLAILLMAGSVYLGRIWSPACGRICS